mmetsp:Transcript_74699/g.144561  ORF Transcript_74699/g.144561 Transcript_74699/m.144561 type:complete len:1086 (-) Transcript_74699:195-3452(-)
MSQLRGHKLLGESQVGKYQELRFAEEGLPESTKQSLVPENDEPRSLSPLSTSRSSRTSGDGQHIPKEEHSIRSYRRVSETASEMTMTNVPTGVSELWDPGRASVAFREDVDEEDLPMATRRRKTQLRTQTFLDRLTTKRSAKSEFGIDVSLALKGAFFVVLGSLPAIFLSLKNHFPRELHALLSSLGLYVVMTLCKTLGETICNACQAIAGAMLAALNVRMMTLIVGLTPESNIAWGFVWFDFVVVVWLLLWLNFDDTIRPIALSTHVNLVMRVMRPPSSTNLKFSGFGLASCATTAVGALIAILAAFIPLIPVLPSATRWRTVDALRKAEEEAQELAALMGQLVMDAVKGFWAHRESLVVDGLIVQATQLHGRLEGMEKLIGAAWWEVKLPFLTPKLAPTKERLQAVTELCEILSGVRDSIVVLLFTLKHQEFRASDESMMEEIELPLHDLAEFLNSELRSALEVLLAAAYAGGPKSEVQGRAEARRQKDLLIQELGQAYLCTLEEMLDETGSSGKKESNEEALKITVQGPENETYNIQDMAQTSQLEYELQSRRSNFTIFYQTMEESHFVYRMILMVDRLIARLEGGLEGDGSVEAGATQVLENTSWKAVATELLWHLVDSNKLFLREHLIFAVRQTITLVVCFWVCLNYYHEPAMVTTQALMVMEGLRYTGSMLKKNMLRLQGVVLGTIFPHLFYDWFRDCSVQQETMRALLLFIFECLALYVYYSSKEWAFVGMLTGAFGARAMSLPCEHERSAGMLTRLYLTMEQNALGIAILMTIDLIFVPDSASKQANKQLVHDKEATNPDDIVGVLPLLQCGLVNALDMDLDTEDHNTFFRSLESIHTHNRRSQGIQPHHDTHGDWSSRVATGLRNASALCDEAYNEPRYMSKPWPDKLYRDVVKISRGLRADIFALQDSMDGAIAAAAQQTSQKGGTQGSVTIFADDPEFRRFTHKLQRALNSLSHMVILALKHFDEERGDEGTRPAEIMAEAQDLRIPTEKDIAQLVRSLVLHPDVLQEEGRRTWKPTAEEAVTFTAEEITRRSRLSIRSHILSDGFVKCSVAVCVLRSIARSLKQLHLSIIEAL